MAMLLSEAALHPSHMFGCHHQQCLGSNGSRAEQGGRRACWTRARAHCILLWLKAGATPLRTRLQKGSLVLVDSTDGQGGLAVPCRACKGMLQNCSAHHLLCLIACVRGPDAGQLLWVQDREPETACHALLRCGNAQCIRLYCANAYQP